MQTGVIRGERLAPTRNSGRVYAVSAMTGNADRSLELRG